MKPIKITAPDITIPENIKDIPNIIIKDLNNKIYEAYLLGIEHGRELERNDK